MNSTITLSSVCTKDLVGITMDPCLKLYKHISNIVHTGHVGANIISKAFVSRDPFDQGFCCIR